jgi:hypothetical protein
MSAVGAAGEGGGSEAEEAAAAAAGSNDAEGVVGAAAAADAEAELPLALRLALRRMGALSIKGNKDLTSVRGRPSAVLKRCRNDCFHGREC